MYCNYAFSYWHITLDIKDSAQSISAPIAVVKKWVVIVVSNQLTEYCHTV